MSEWKEGTLRQACDISTGFAFKGDKYESSGSLRVVRGENVTIGDLRWDSEKHWNHSTDGLEEYFLQANDIVIGMDGSRVGQNRAKIRAADLPLILAQRVARLRAKQDFDQGFIWYQIIDDRFKDYVDAVHTGTSIPHISMNQIADYEISFPDAPEQKAIAAVLSSLDDKIDLLHRQNITLEAMAEVIFRQWFVEEAQEDWEDGSLGDVIELHYGKGLKTEERSGSGYPVVGSSGVVNYHEQYLVDGPGIVIGRKGTLGKVIYLWENFYPIDTTYYVKSKAKSVGMLYEYFLLKTIDFENMNTDSAVPGLNRDIALSTEIKIPPENRLHDFNRLVADFVGKLKTNRDQIRTIEKLRDTLLPKLMSGEIRVNK